MSYGFSAGGHSVFHTGDTETHPSLFKEIGQHMAHSHGGCDLGLMSVEPMRREIYARRAYDPEGGVTMGRELAARPMHWGTFILSFEPSKSRVSVFVEAGNQALVMKIGETVPMKAIAR